MLCGSGEVDVEHFLVRCPVGGLLERIGEIKGARGRRALMLSMRIEAFDSVLMGKEEGVVA